MSENYMSTDAKTTSGKTKRGLRAWDEIRRLEAEVALWKERAESAWARGDDEAETRIRLMAENERLRDAIRQFYVVLYDGYEHGAMGDCFERSLEKVFIERGITKEGLD